ncbi:MAG: helix-turn-helix transcriptional regulator [Bacteroidales bacterium]|nr:helix-turn-helix transcriptional regulator [Bacteroidales bacterium]
MGIYTISSFLPENSTLIFKWLDSINIHNFIFNIIIYNLEFLVIISFYLVWSNKVIDNDRKKLGKSFALFYIICNSMSLLALLFITKLYISELLLWSVQIFVMSIFILAPFLWIKFVFIKYAQEMSKLINSSVLIQSIYNKHNISKREQEIIQLILNGKGNNEIKEALFISYHTVKNHISNIYRKLNVSSRHELVHFFLKSKDI